MVVWRADRTPNTSEQASLLRGEDAVVGDEESQNYAHDTDHADGVSVGVLPAQQNPGESAGMVYDQGMGMGGYDGNDDTATQDDVTSAVGLSALFSAFNRFLIALLVWSIFGLALLAVALIFELAYPFTSTPEELFDTALGMVNTTQKYSDIGLTALNIGMSILRPLIPLWNGLSNYIVEPVVFIMIETIAQVVTGDNNFFFLMSQGEEDEPFHGYNCYATDLKGKSLDEWEESNPFYDENNRPYRPDDVKEHITIGRSSQAWCGLYTYYAAGITGVEDAHLMAHPRRPGETGTERARRLRDDSGGIFSLPRGVARRLSERTGAPTLPVISFQNIKRVMSKIAGYLVSFGGMVVDLAMHVLFVLFDDVIVVLVPVIIDMVRILFSLLYVLITSGFFAEILKMALDFIVVLAFDIAVPLIMGILDIFKCVFRLFDTATYAEELKCISTHCFQKGTDTAQDLLVFTSAMMVMDQVYKTVQDTYNGARRMFGLNSIDIESGWLNQANTWWTNHTGECASCFQCKVCRPFSLTTHTAPTHTHTSSSIPPTITSL